MPAMFCAGRADYFGNSANLAARVTGLAQPGQILVEATGGLSRGTPVQGPGSSAGSIADLSVRSRAPSLPFLYV